MMITCESNGVFTIRNQKNLSAIKTIKHDFGYLESGLCYPEERKVILVEYDTRGYNLVEFDY